ncbi:sensor histidine kinase [Streptomyces flavalbus]|uniref:histidine kinase n=1 Tax=Streptomyces flavalbus TaxID=2665155 RepID=A0ABW2W015_9ACTN
MRVWGSFASRPVPGAVTDGALAVLTAATCLALPAAVPPGGADLRSPDGWWLALALLSTLPLAVHRMVPLASLLVMAVASGTLQHLSYVPQLAGPDGTSIGPTYLALAAAVFLTAVRCAPRVTTFVAAVFIPSSAVAEAVLAPAGHRLAALLTDAVLLLAAWALGRLSRARAAVRDEAMRRAAALEREQAANARAAVMRERARIARELHDIVAHNVSLMVVQTIAADRVQDRSPDKAHELHATVEQTGRATVTELRRLLDVLRTDEDTGAAPSKEPPQPTIDALPALLDAVRATGLRADYEVSGTPVELPAGYHLTVYRIVQEALTNTVKHAGATRTRVRLLWDEEPERLHVRVCDDGPVGAGPAPAVRAPVSPGGPGHGLLGMRERIAATGGTLHTGPRPGGGYCVHAVLHLPEPDGTTNTGGTAHHGVHQRPAG